MLPLSQDSQEKKPLSEISLSGEPEVALPEGVPNDTLEEALKRHQIKLPKNKITKIDTYCQILWEKNTHLNLTRHTDYEKFVTRDLVDSMRLAELLTQGEHVLDVGTGGGVPGILLAILRPDLLVELCDSTGKKAIAVGEMVDLLGLDLPVWHARGEILLKVHRFQTIVIRAVARLKKIMEWFSPHWFAFDRLLLVKGPRWVEERGESRHFGQFGKSTLRKLVSYKIPGTEVESVILQICLKEKLEKLKAGGGVIPPEPPREELRRSFRKKSTKGARKNVSKKEKNAKADFAKTKKAEKKGKISKKTAKRSSGKTGAKKSVLANKKSTKKPGKKIEKSFKRTPGKRS
ncbi:MAG: 16S rRNA (guanine(527)-N(7))-methyltransferase RsmG [Planctomycetaceae bacterium]|nr:16S rRNA (guanine(527)-N(7))-methyltransferase RsmG [Planctomycetaceae bacterium]